jgi:hypothetical protein
LATPVFAAPRLALVIGNSNYELKSAQIPSAEKDAAAIAKRLAEVDFDVDLVKNANKAGLRAAVDHFASRLRAAPGATALLFYAGHGAQLNQANYLIPIDATDAMKLNENSVSLGEIYKVFAQTKPSLALVMLDACRTKIFGDQPGLAEFDTGAPSGTIKAFATKPGKTVGGSVDGKTSAYTKAILQYLGEPGTTLSDFFIQVRKAVELYTDDHDTPWENTSQKVPFVFREPAYLRIDKSGDIDDDVILTAGAGTWVNSIDPPSKQLRLHIGDNVVTATVVNFKSKNDQFEEEGWHYTVTISAVNGGAQQRLHGEENIPGTPQRFGGVFVAARTIANVDRLTGKITISDIEPAVWEDGFSLLGVEQSDWLYESIRWAVGHGAPLFDTDHPVAPRSPAEVQKLTTEAHEQAITHSHGTTEETEQAHRPHLRAKTLVQAATTDDVRTVLERVRPEVFAEVDRNLTAIRRRTPLLESRLQSWSAEGSYEQIRELYRIAVEKNEHARVLIDSISNDDIQTILTR